MKYIAFVWSEHVPTPEEIAVMQRETPRWIDEMEGRNVRLLGRELEFPEKAATVRVRKGETLMTDGPFVETKEFIAGFDLLECAEIDEAIEVAAKHSVAWFHAIEVRPFAEGLELGDKASAFGRGDDGATKPYLLAMMMAGDRSAPWNDQSAVQEDDAWRRELKARGAHVLGNRLAGPDAARTVRVRGGETLTSDGPLIETKEFIAGIDVVTCADRGQAIELAAVHPLARHHAIEVWPFWSE